jgi:hypothetical protein
MSDETKEMSEQPRRLDGLVRHASGMETFEESGISVMRCPECGTENEWPYDDGGDEAECYGGCGARFKYDNDSPTA